MSGNVQRIGPLGITQSALHAKAIKGRRTRTHISATPALFYDISVWNKLFRRSFWTEHGLTYPEGMVWEDIQVMTQAHVLASAVDVIPDSIYYWRERSTGALSITQSRTDISNYTDRITALLAIDAFLRGRLAGPAGPPASAQGAGQRHLAVRRRAGPDDRQLPGRVRRLTQRYLAQVDRRVSGSCRRSTGWPTT